MQNNPHSAPNAAGDVIVFLDPAVVLDEPAQHITIDRASSADTYVPGGVLGNAPVLALNWLCQRLRAKLVITSLAGPYDPRDQLLGRGFAAGQFAVDWKTDQDFPDRMSGIRRWRDAHPGTRAVIIDRLDVPARGAILARVASGVPFTNAVVERIVGAIGAAAGSAARNA